MVQNARGRMASSVVAGAIALAAVTVNAVGCSGDKPVSGLGNAGRGGAMSSRGGMGGSIGGGGGSGTAGMAAGGTGGAQPGCQTPLGTPGTWEEIAPMQGLANFHVTDTFTVGANDLIFAGYIGDPTGASGPFTEARFLRWTQGCWTLELTIPAGTAPIDFPSVHGLGAGDIWASAGQAIFHRDAQGWTPLANNAWLTQIRLPPFSSPAELIRVRAAAPNDVWFAATSNILRWNGQAWTTYNFDDPNYPNESASIGFFFRSIWIDSPTSVWVGGGADQVGNTMESSIMNHFDGTNWTRTGLPALGQVYAIWRAGSVLWLANPSVGNTLVRFDGTAGVVAPILGVDPSNTPSLTSLFGRGANDVWAAGDDVAHFDGQDWSLDPGVPALARNPTDENNTFVAGDAGAVWLVVSGPAPHFFRLVTGP